MKPIIFNTEMVKAILEGRKTQTRRPIKLTKDYKSYGIKLYDCIYEKIGKLRTKLESGKWKDIGFNSVFLTPVKKWLDKNHPLRFFIKLPYKVGDILYVRETWQKVDGKKYYRASVDNLSYWPGHNLPWKPSIHMPKEAARLFLKVTGVRVERVQDINQNRHDDILNEGWPFQIGAGEQPYCDFKKLWNSIYNNWSTNPWVWVFEFKIKEVKS
jgi:hypothetical protein